MNIITIHYNGSFSLKPLTKQDRDNFSNDTCEMIFFCTRIENAQKDTLETGYPEFESLHSNCT